MAGDLYAVASGHKETNTLKLVVIHFAESRIRSDIDDLWQTVKTRPLQ